MSVNRRSNRYNFDEDFFRREEYFFDDEYIFGSEVRERYGYNKEFSSEKQAVDNLAKEKKVKEKNPSGKILPARKKNIRPKQKNDPLSSLAVDVNIKTRKNFDTMYKKVLFTCVTAIFLMAVFYIRGFVKINDLNNSIKSMYNKKTALFDATNALQGDIDKAFNLDEVKEYAGKHLKMVEAKESRVIYYDGEGEDYYHQY